MYVFCRAIQQKIHLNLKAKINCLPGHKGSIFENLIYALSLVW